MLSISRLRSSPSRRSGRLTSLVRPRADPMTTQDQFSKFDDLLSDSDPDVQDWSDGCDCEVAEGYLKQFSDSDWSKLSSIWQSKGNNWRGCLASILTPKHGAIAASLLVKLAFDDNPDVAFYALNQICHACGVGANREGPFVDKRICVPSFLELAQANADLPLQITKISSKCAPIFADRFALLNQVLEHKM